MVRRGWTFAVSISVVSGMLPACTHAPNRDALPVRRAAPPFLAEPPPAVSSQGINPFPPPEVNPRPTIVSDQGDPQTNEIASPATTIGAPEIATASGPDVSASEPRTVAKLVPDAPLVEAVRCIVNNQPEAALEKLRGLDKTNQELLLAILPLAVWLADTHLAQAKPREIATLVDNIDSVVNPLRARAPLTMDRLCFCRSIRGFGDYVPWPPDHRFHRGDPVLIYVELRNLVEVPRPASEGETRYALHVVGSAQIRDQAGHVVLSDPIIFERQGPQVELSRNFRHDYSDAYSFRVPADLPPGSYTLQVQVEDRGTNPPRKVTRSMDFRVTSLAPAGT